MVKYPKWFCKTVGAFTGGEHLLGKYVNEQLAVIHEGGWEVQGVWWAADGKTARITYST